MKYRGYDIEAVLPNFYAAADDDFDADYIDGSFVQCSGKPTIHGKSIEAVKESIDEHYLEVSDES